MKKFLFLPGEVRNKIYRLALVDPPLRTRHHSAFCEYCPHGPKRIPIPPLVLVKDESDCGLRVCPCAKRHGLGLLRSCPRIHAEATPIFWSENAFLFQSKHDFISCVLKNMSADRRRWIADVMILSRTNSGRRRASFEDEVDGDDTATSTTEHLWDVILNCSGLRNLELHPAYFDYQGNKMKWIPECLPNLVSLRACDLRYRAYRAPSNDNAGLRPYQARVPAVYFIASLPITWFPGFSDRGAGWESHRNAVNADLAFRVALAHQITHELGIPWGSTESINTLVLDLQSDYPMRQINRFILEPVQSLTMSTDVVTVDFLGLPLSKEELKDNRRLRQLHGKLLESGKSGLCDAVIHNRFWYGNSRSTYPRRLKQMARALIVITVVIFLRPRGEELTRKTSVLRAIQMILGLLIVLGEICYNRVVG